MSQNDSELVKVLVEKTDMIMKSIIKLTEVDKQQSTQITELQRQIRDLTGIIRSLQSRID